MTQVGKYQLVRKIAVGGMAEVWLAKAAGPMGFEKKLVLKRILPHLAEDPNFVDMFLSEAKLAAQLNHPNVVQIFDFGHAEGAYYIAMEFIDGPNLRSLSKRASDVAAVLPFALCAKVISFACEGLAYAHDFADPDTGQPLNLIHRDISPDNILLSKNGAVKVVDFGIAKAAGRTHQTKTGTLKGKLAYMPPEQLQGKVVLDRRADVFALGVVLYELVTGMKPFDATSEVSIMQAILYEPLIPITLRRSDVPEGLSRILDRALAKDREQRYPTCREFQADVERFIISTGESIGAFQLASLVTQLASATPVGGAPGTPTGTPPSGQGTPGSGGYPSGGFLPPGSSGAFPSVGPMGTPSGAYAAQRTPGSGAFPSGAQAAIPGGGVAFPAGGVPVPTPSGVHGPVLATPSGGYPAYGTPMTPGGGIPVPFSGENEASRSVTSPLRPAGRLNGESNEMTSLEHMAREAGGPIPLTARRPSRETPAQKKESKAPVWIGFLGVLLLAGGAGFVYWNNARNEAEKARVEAENKKAGEEKLALQKKAEEEAKAQAAVEEKRRAEEAAQADKKKAEAEAQKKRQEDERKAGAKSGPKTPPAKEPEQPIVAKKPPPPPAANGARLVVEAVPSGMQVKVNGEFKGSAGSPILNLATGDATVEVYNSRVGSKQVSTRLVPGENRLRVELGQGKVDFRVRPWANVYIDDKLQGQTPFSAPVMVYEGSHRVKLVSEKGTVFETNVKVEAGKQADVRYVFQGE